MGNYGLAELSGERRLPLTQSKRKKKKKANAGLLSYRLIAHTHRQTGIQTDKYTHAAIHASNLHTLVGHHRRHAGSAAILQDCSGIFN